MKFTGWKHSIAVLGLGLSFSGAQAATVAVIDSGLDIEHPELLEKIWLNPVDNTHNNVDEDNNGLLDDIHGWNFAENNADLIDRTYSSIFNDEIERFFAVQAKSLNGQATEGDKEWAKERVHDKEFIKNLSIYGNYAHGTHVSGIVSRQGDNINVLGVKLIPTKNPLQSLTAEVTSDLAAGKNVNWIVKQTIKAGLSLFAKLQAKALEPIGQYADLEKADVANGSFGFGPQQARMLLKPLLKLALRGTEPSTEQVDELAAYFLKKVTIHQEALVAAAPKTLFVFAAGNDGSNNDLFPTSPASVNRPNKLSVAAVFEDGRLAPFSNYGESVDLAAVGVSVDSTVPDNRRLAMSGTSQASPQVAGTAGAVKAINPSLDAAGLKALILGTVDVTPELKGKVKSSGVLNTPRALEAARLSKSMSVAEAIKTANKKVASQLKHSFAPTESDNSLFVNLQPQLLGN